MITIRIFSSRIEGEIIADILTQNGINCLFLSDDEGGLNPHLGIATGYQIQVRKEDVEESKSLLLTKPLILIRVLERPDFFSFTK